MPVTISIPRDKNLFRLDSPEIIKRMDAATIRGIARASGLVRIIARRSMNRRARPAAPGETPSVRNGAIKNLLIFGIESGGFGSVIGSIGFGNSDAPSLLEYGGWSKTGRIVTRLDASASKTSPGGWRRVRTRPGHPRHPGWRTVGPAQAKGEKISIRQTAPLLARPYMNPALETAMPRIPEEWRGRFR